MAKKALLLIGLILITSHSFSQTMRTEQRFGMNGYIGGPGGILGATADYFVSSSFNLETGIGTFVTTRTMYFGGVKYHLFGWDAEHLTPYIGIFYSTNWEIDAWYYPFGIHFMNYSGFTFAIEGARVVERQRVISDNPSFFWFGLKIGFHIPKWEEKDHSKYKRPKSTYKDENYEFHK